MSVCLSVCLFVCFIATMFSTIAPLRDNGYSQLDETFIIDGHRLWDQATKFARWQHPAVGRGTRFAVSVTVYSVWFCAVD